MKPFFKPEDLEEFFKRLKQSLPVEHYWSPKINLENWLYDLVDAINAKLLREGRVVFTHLDNDPYFNEKIAPGDTHKALLINIEPIEPACKVNHKEFICGDCFKEFDMIEKKPPCSHPKEKVRERVCLGIIERQCECGARVTPLTYGEVE